MLIGQINGQNWVIFTDGVESTSHNVEQLIRHSNCSVINCSHLHKTVIYSFEHIIQRNFQYRMLCGTLQWPYRHVTAPHKLSYRACKRK